MSKIYIQTEGERVTLIHNMPFDSVNGLGKSAEELQRTGVLLDSVPQAQVIEGKIALPHYNEQDGFYYVYEAAPPRPANTNDLQAISAKLDYVAMMTEVL